MLRPNWGTSGGAPAAVQDAGAEPRLVLDPVLPGLEPVAEHVPAAARGTATSASVLSISHALLSSVPPHTRRVPCPTRGTCLSGADWCLRSDVMPDYTSPGFRPVPGTPRGDPAAVRRCKLPRGGSLEVTLKPSPIPSHHHHNHHNHHHLLLLLLHHHHHLDLNNLRHLSHLSHLSHLPLPRAVSFGVRPNVRLVPARACAFVPSCQCPHLHIPDSPRVCRLWDVVIAGCTPRRGASSWLHGCCTQTHSPSSSTWTRYNDFDISLLRFFPCDSGNADITVTHLAVFIALLDIV